MRRENDILKMGDQIAGLTLAQAIELAQYLEQVHGIKASAMSVVAPDLVVDDKKGQVEPEPTEFAVVLEGFDAAKKLAVIKGVRENTGLGLKEAKETVEGFPRVIKEGLPKAEADALKAELEAAGAKVSLKTA